MNAVVDARAMVRGVPDFLRNNTYGLDLLPDNDMLDEVLESVPGCYDAIDDCRAAVAEGDPEGFGGNSEVNQKCVAATKACMGFIFRFGQEASVRIVEHVAICLGSWINIFVRHGGTTSLRTISRESHPSTTQHSSTRHGFKQSLVCR